MDNPRVAPRAARRRAGVTCCFPVATPVPALERVLSAGYSAVRCLAMIAVTPCVLGAQDVDSEAVDSSRQVYLGAYQAYLQARSAGDELLERWEDLLDQLNQADDESARRLRPDIHELAQERENALTELRQVEPEWREAGRTLIQLISRYQLNLSDQLLVAEEGAQQDLLDEFDEMRNLRGEVEGQMGPRELGLPEAPNIQALPEDTPVDRARKAARLDEYVDKLEAFLPILKDEIERLERDQQRVAQMRAFGADPLGVRTVPVGAGGAGGGQGGADATEVDLAQQIETLKQWEAQVEDDVERFRIQADELRRRPGGTR